MNPGLVYLLRRGPAAKFRYLRRRSQGSKGVLFLVLGALFLLLVIGSQILLAFHSEKSELPPADLERVRLFATGGLFVLLLLNFSVGGGIHFRPSEIDFLFPAPVSRRDLILYHHLRVFGLLLLSSSWMFLFLGWRHSPIGVFGFLGTFSAFLFLNFSSQAMGLLFGALASQAGQKIRRMTLLAIVAVVGIAVWSQREAIREGFSTLEILERASAFPLVSVLMAPCRPFVELFLAQTVLGAIPWLGACALLLVTLFRFVVWLDAHFEESAIRSSQRMQQRIEKVRSSGAYSQTSSKKGSFVFPHFPRMAGAGPILWRQAMEVLRSWKGVLLGTGLMGLWMVIMLGSKESARQLPQDDQIPFDIRIFLFAQLATFFMVQNLIFDFRKDLDRMAYLKSLPISPMAISVGQTGIAALLFTVVQAILLTIAGLVWHGRFPESFGWTLLICAPFNWLVVAVQNLGFLIAPHRPAPKTGFDPAFMARMIVQTLARMVAVAILFSAAFGLGWAAYRLFDRSWDAALVGGGIAIALFLWLLVWMMGRAFSAFDVSKDIPG